MVLLIHHQEAHHYMQWLDKAYLLILLYLIQNGQKYLILILLRSMLILGLKHLAMMAQRHGLSALRHDAGKEGHDEDLEHRAGEHHLLPVHSRDAADALGHRAIGARFRAQ